jgi:hypothetical protein
MSEIASNGERKRLEQFALREMLVAVYCDGENPRLGEEQRGNEQHRKAEVVQWSMPHEGRSRVGRGRAHRKLL